MIENIRKDGYQEPVDDALQESGDQDVFRKFTLPSANAALVSVS